MDQWKLICSVAAAVTVLSVLSNIGQILSSFGMFGGMIEMIVIFNKLVLLVNLYASIIFSDLINSRRGSI